MSSYAMSKSLKRIAALAKRDGRYKVEAYLFVQQSLAYSQLKRSQRGSSTKELEPISDEAHLSGQQLCEDIRRYAQELYGLMAKTVLNHWGIHSTSDLGEIVYQLIDLGEMTKSSTDQRTDFDNVYDFERAFSHRYKFSRMEE